MVRGHFPILPPKLGTIAAFASGMTWCRKEALKYSFFRTLFYRSYLLIRAALDWNWNLDSFLNILYSSFGGLE
jgi:hypothetical protein